MYPVGDGIFLVLGINLVWLLGLTFFVVKNHLFLKELFPQEKGNFKDKLVEVLSDFRQLEEFKKQSLKHLQKVSLKRFNPYQDTGGDQSFTVALLDGQNSGMVITSLHSRAGTRVFAKPVLDGKENQFEFSKEEKEVVEQATKI